MHPKYGWNGTVSRVFPLIALIALGAFFHSTPRSAQKRHKQRKVFWEKLKWWIRGSKTECTKIARFSAVAAAIFTARGKIARLFEAPRCAISSAKKIASEPRLFLRCKLVKMILAAEFPAITSSAIKIASERRCASLVHSGFQDPKNSSETGRIRFRGVRFQTPNSVSFSGLTEFRGANSVSSFQPIICVQARTHRVSCRTHRVCRRTQWVLSSETVLSKQYSARFLTAEILYTQHRESWKDGRVIPWLVRSQGVGRSCCWGSAFARPAPVQRVPTPNSDAERALRGHQALSPALYLSLCLYLYLYIYIYALWSYYLGQVWPF